MRRLKKSHSNDKFFEAATFKGVWVISIWKEQKELEVYFGLYECVLFL